MTTMNDAPLGYMPIPTVEQLADAMANVRCFHDLSAELIAPELLKNLLAAIAQPTQQGEAVEVVEVVGYRFFHVDHGYIFRRTHIYEGNPSLEAHSLMTVAQHERILAASVTAVADCDDSGSVTLTTEAAQIIAQCIGAHAYVMGALQNGRPDLALAESARWVEGFSHASLLASAGQEVKP